MQASSEAAGADAAEDSSEGPPASYRPEADDEFVSGTGTAGGASGGEDFAASEDNAIDRLAADD